VGAATSRHVNILAGWGLGLLLPMTVSAGEQVGRGRDAVDDTDVPDAHDPHGRV